MDPQPAIGRVPQDASRRHAVGPVYSDRDRSPAWHLHAELGKRKAIQGGAPAYLYRFDWETPEGGGHMRSPHTIENSVRV